MAGNWGTVRLNVGGKHNVANSLAAIGAALEVGVDLETIKASLENFSLARTALPGSAFQPLAAGHR